MKYLILLCAIFMSCGPPVKPVSKYQFPDDEFLYWCRDDEGNGKSWPVSIERPMDCNSVSRGEWDHLPITVMTEESLELEAEEAVKMFNKQVGFELFKVIPTDLLEEDVMPDILAFSMGAHIYAAAEAKHFTDNDGVHRGAVIFYNGYQDDDRADIFMHELGHLVGLRHDFDNRMSIMYTGQGSRVSALEDQDIRALQFMYRWLT